MTGFSMLVMMLAGGVLQAILPTAPWLGEVRPPVLLSLSLYYALTREQAPLGAAVLAGFVQDALGPLPLGASSLCFCGVVLLAHRRREGVFIGRGLTHVVFGALGSGLATLAVYGLMVSGDLLRLPVSRVALKTASAMALGGLVAPAVFAVMERLDRALGNREAIHA